MRCPTLPLMLALAALCETSLAQSITSDFPSRTAILEQSDRVAGNASIVNHSRKHMLGRYVMGYVTPWNEKGPELVERYRGKFDAVAPCWHTVEVVRTGDKETGQTFYEIKGQPTEKDKAWQARLQESIEDVAKYGKTLEPVQVLPRFALDQWTPEDLAQMVSSQELSGKLAAAITATAIEGDYDGIVFESSSVWALESIVELLAAQLHLVGKTLTIVIPALRPDVNDAKGEKINRIVLVALKRLGPLADRVHVMTYDYSMGGRKLRETIDLKTLPEGSPLLHEGVRLPGPNTPLEWLRSNLEMLSGSLETPGSETVFGNLAEVAEYVNANNLKEKLLMGVALYGWSWPVSWHSVRTMDAQGQPRLPPPSPIEKKDNDEEAQAAARAKAAAKDEALGHVPVVRYGADPFTQSDLIMRLQKHKALIRQDEVSGEQLVDYIAQLPDEFQPKEAAEQGKGKMSGYYRAYFPSASTIRQRLEIIEDFDGAGVAAWDVGQSGAWLLDAL